MYEESQTLEQNWEKFKSTLDCAVKKFIPKSEIRIKQNKMPMRLAVRDAVREKQKNWRDIRGDKTPENYENTRRLETKSKN